MTVYDVTGKVIFQLVAGYAAGLNAVKLDRNRLLSSGLLYYMIERGDYVATKMMFVLDYLNRA